MPLQNDILTGIYGGGMKGLDALLKQLTGSYQTNVAGMSMPGLSPADQAALQQQYQTSVDTQTEFLRKKLMEQLGSIGASASTRGMRSSSAHGRAVGSAMGDYSLALQQLMAEAQAQRLNTELQLRNALLGAQTQNFGTLAGLGSSMLGTRMQGYGLLGDLQGQQQQRNAAMIGALGGIGKALPALGGWLGIGRNIWED